MHVHISDTMRMMWQWAVGDKPGNTTSMDTEDEVKQHGGKAEVGEDGNDEKGDGDEEEDEDEESGEESRGKGSKGDEDKDNGGNSNKDQSSEESARDGDEELRTPHKPGT
jgi:hypothetical protein